MQCVLYVFLFPLSIFLLRLYIRLSWDTSVVRRTMASVRSLSQVLNWSWWPGELLIKNNKIQTFTSITITKGKNYKPVLIQAFLPPRTNERNSLFESLQIRALSTSVLVRTGKLIYSVILWVIITTYNMLLTHQVIGMVLVKVLYSYICTGYHPKVDLRWSNWTVRCGTMWTRNIMARHWMSWMVF